VFQLYEIILHKLGSNDNLQLALRLFERDLLHILGYALLLDQDANSAEAIQANSQYEYHIEHGPVKTVRPGNGLVISGNTLIELQQGKLMGKTSYKEAKVLMRTILDYYLGGKPLRSRELLTNEY
jgi:DNA repair protein RecO (recombination protein O)